MISCSFNIFKSENVHRSIFPKNNSDSSVDYQNYIDLNADSGFSFSRFCNLSPNDMERVALGNAFEL